LQSIVISETQAETLGTASSNSARRRGTPRFAPRDRRYWSRNQSILQRSEFSRTFAPWIERCVPSFSIEVGTSLALAALLTEADLIGPKAFREKLQGSGWQACLATTPRYAFRRLRSSRRGATIGSRRS